MKGSEIRQSYLDFFKSKQHQIVESASVVPHDDPTLYFTNAGMNQFKPFFLGQATPEHRRVADTQKCIRVQGKHNDLEEVGHDTYHHTFFEMLGNWSFGDYYKKEAIEWAWELFTKVWKLPKERLYATVFAGEGEVAGDEEAVTLWQTVTDIDHSHIRRCGKKDNFWMMGETGPCGPCTEIHIDLTPDMSGGPLVNEGSPMVMELWNLVFIQYNAEPDGSLRELPAKHVDTGMGFERACAVMECTKGCTDFSLPFSNYDTEVFQPIIRTVEKMSGRKYTPGQSTDMDSIALRVIADHIRMISFSIADGALPSNDGRGYVVRRLLRRAARYARKIGLNEPFLYQLVQVLVDNFGQAFPELKREQNKLEKIIKAEEESFNQTLDRGLNLFEDVVALLPSSAKGPQTFPAEAAFKLYDTYGFPFDLTEVLARERNLGVDVEGFERLMTQQKEKARAAHNKVIVSAASEDLHLPPTSFVGYEYLTSKATISAILANPQPTETDSHFVFLDNTPFYGEMGGQLGDFGKLTTENGTVIPVSRTTKKEGVVFHHVGGADLDALEVGHSVQACVEKSRRQEIQRHHTATHLLHWALREVLGKDVRQQGSLVAPDRLRFDFTHYQHLSDSELRTVEKLINDRIIANCKVSWFEIPYAKKPDSVIAFFGDKYGEKVRVVKIGGKGSGHVGEPHFDGYSMELCGGTHTFATGELGMFRFLSEGAIAAGVRRVEAVCGFAGWESWSRELRVLDGVSKRLGVPVDGISDKLEALLEQQKTLQRQVENARQIEAGNKANQLLTSAVKVGEIAMISGRFDGEGSEYLRWVSDSIKSRFDGVCVLSGATDDKVSLLVSVGPNTLKTGVHAGKLVKVLAQQVGGGGGGRPDLAEAGGKDVAALDGLLANLSQTVAQHLQQA